MMDVVYRLYALTLVVLVLGGTLGWWFVRHRRPRRRARRASAAQHRHVHMERLTREARRGAVPPHPAPGPHLFRRILAQRGLRHPDETPPMPRGVFLGVVAGLCIGPLAARFVAQDLAMILGMAALPVVVVVVLWLDDRRSRRRRRSDAGRSFHDVF